MLLDRWEHVVSEIAGGMGYELIDLELGESGLVRIFIDIVDNNRDVNVKDCELLTRQLLYQLPVENLSFERLEVSSPGIDRKLTKASHFERFLGSRIRISLKESIENIKNFEGILRKNEDDGDGEDGQDGEDDDQKDYDDQYVCRRGRTALWTSELCTWSDQRWHRPELVELLFGRCVPSVKQRSISNYMICEGNSLSTALPLLSMVEAIHLRLNMS